MSAALSLVARRQKSISSIVPVFDVSLYNLSSDQTYSPRWGLPQQPCFVVTAPGISFHTCEEERRVRLTAPLTCGIAQGLVPGGGQGLHCNREGGERERLINNLNLCLLGSDGGYENLIRFSLTATKGWALKGNGKHWWQTFSRSNNSTVAANMNVDVPPRGQAINSVITQDDLEEKSRK